MSTDSDLREGVLDQWHGLLFDVRRSRRYHMRREQFFGRFHFAAGFLTAMAGSATFATVLADLPLGIWLAALTAIFGACELVGQPFSRVLTHRELTREFTLLEKAMQLPAAEVSEAVLRKLQARRLDIEEKEPPTLQVLNVMCHNEEVLASGYGPKYFKKVRWHQRLLASLFDLSVHTFQKSAPRG